MQMYCPVWGLLYDMSTGVSSRFSGTTAGVGVDSQEISQSIQYILCTHSPYVSPAKCALALLGKTKCICKVSYDCWVIMWPRVTRWHCFGPVPPPPPPPPTTTVGTDLNFRGNPPDSKVHGANKGPIWVLSAPGGPHFGPMNLAIRALRLSPSMLHDWHSCGHIFWQPCWWLWVKVMLPLKWMLG